MRYSHFSKLAHSFSLIHLPQIFRVDQALLRSLDSLYPNGEVEFFESLAQIRLIPRGQRISSFRLNAGFRCPQEGLRRLIADTNRKRREPDEGTDSCKGYHAVRCETDS